MESERIVTQVQEGQIEKNSGSCSFYREGKCGLDQTYCTQESSRVCETYSVIFAYNYPVTGLEI